MNRKKREFCTYLNFDYRGVEAHLSKMAARGWRLEKVGPWFWTYRRAEPARVTYAVTYLPDASQFDPDPSEQQASLAELCAAAGWEKAADWGQMQIFVNERPDPVPLETDEAVRLEVIHRSMKKGFLRWGAVMLVLALVMAGLQVKTLLTDPFHLLSSSSGLFSAALWDLLVILQTANLLGYWRWYRKSAQSVAQGGPCAAAGRGLRLLNLIALWLVGICLVLYLAATAATAESDQSVFMVCYLALFELIVFLLDRIRRALRRQGVSRRKNLAITLVMDVVLSVVLVGGLFTAYGILRFSGVLDGDGTYIYEHREWDTSPEPLPLTLEDLTGEAYPHVRRNRYGSGSFLVREDHCWETVLDAADDGMGLDYTITTLALPSLRDLAAESILTEWTDRGYYDWVEADPAPWGADAAYRQIFDDGWDRFLTGDYLLCWPDRVVEISLTDLEPTPGQMAVIGEKLQNA